MTPMYSVPAVLAGFAFRDPSANSRWRLSIGDSATIPPLSSSLLGQCRGVVVLSQLILHRQQKGH